MNDALLEWICLTVTIPDVALEDLLRRFIRAMEVEQRRHEYVSVEYFTNEKVAKLELSAREAVLLMD